QQRMFCPATSVENASAVGENRRAKPAEPSDLAHPLAPRAVSALVNVNAGPLIRRPSPGMLRPKVCVGAGLRHQRTLRPLAAPGASVAHHKCASLRSGTS